MENRSADLHTPIHPPPHPSSQADHAKGVFVPYVFFLTGLPSNSLHLTARQGKGDKANSLKSGQCKTQTADYCFHHANENVTTIVPLFSNPKNNSPQSAFYTAPFKIKTLRTDSSLRNEYFVVHPFQAGRIMP